MRVREKERAKRERNRGTRRERQKNKPTFHENKSQILPQHLNINRRAFVTRDLIV